jgi:hypothetical protein
MNHFFSKAANLLAPLRLIPFDISNALNAFQYEMAARPAERFHEPKRLLKYGYKVYSQNDEDGIIEEIFRRIGATSKTFVEFGVGPHENNSLRLLLLGWSGLWMDGGRSNIKKARRAAADYLRDEKLRIVEAFITRENIDALLKAGGAAGEIDFLSVDLDGNDYWIWEAIESIHPRVVCIEYNATLRPPISVAMKYAERHSWNGTNYFGASLSALEKLGARKGYRLVGCNIAGQNAFFVRNDLVPDAFAAPFTAENHYEPARYFSFRAGHAPEFGSYERV